MSLYLRRVTLILFLSINDDILFSFNIIKSFGFMLINLNKFNLAIIIFEYMKFPNLE